MLEQSERARRYQAPDDLLRAMETGRAIVFFEGNSPADYFGEEIFPWEEQTRTASVIQGNGTPWHIAIWKNAPGDIDFDPAVASYDAYLASL